jgi:predicted enzyme related to lactoylglutathione lyase
MVASRKIQRQRGCGRRLDRHEEVTTTRGARPDVENPVGWFEVYVQDMTRARAFYEAVFDVQLTKLEGTQFEMWAFPTRPHGSGAPGALVKLPGYPSGGNSVIVYFSCADCAVEASKAASSGGMIETSKKSVGQYGYIALVFDTEGNIIGLHSLQ